MIYLLDTHVILWWLEDSPRLPAAVRNELSKPETVGYFSQVSLLEIEIKRSLGKLKLKMPMNRFVELAEESGLTFLPLSNAAILSWGTLPPLHRDPFDRLLVGEALALDVPLCTSDKLLRRYPAEIFWP